MEVRGAFHRRSRFTAGAALAFGAFFALGIAGAQSQAPHLSGQVVDRNGGGVRDAELAIAGTARRETSGVEGRFRFAGVPGVRFVVHVRRLGFRPESLEVDPASPSFSTPVSIRMTAIAQQLGEVKVDAPPEAYDFRLAGFERRRLLKLGHFVTRERLERQNSANLSDLLREIPGVRVGPLRGLSHAVRIRGASCAPAVWIDGFQANATEFDLDMIDPMSVEGVEVYSSGSSVPHEFIGSSSESSCGVLVIWSRPSRAPRGRQGPPAPSRTIDLESLLRTGLVFTAGQVDSLARPDSVGVVPDYPDSLWRSGTSGHVLAEFVVSAMGDVETETVRIVVASHPLFAEAVQRALATAHFVPATLAGRGVRQVVQAPFEFVAARRDARKPQG